MKEGLLWYDDDPGRDLPNKIERAGQHYQQKFGRRPNLCYVHPSLLARSRTMGKIKVTPLSTVLRHHFWIGEKA